MQSTYFGKIPGIGKLNVEQVFYYMDEPILFTALDENKVRYLCSCCKLGTEYLITPATNETLLDLIHNKITIRQAFLNQNATGITWDGEHVKILDNLPYDMYPEENAFLDMAENEAIVTYANTLTQETE